MMTRSRDMLSGSAVFTFMTALALVEPVGAQVSTSGNAPTSASTLPATEKVDEIVVTARRKEEVLQDVPVVVDVVSAKSLKDLNILQFQDVQAVVPGLQITSTTQGYDVTTSLRGVTTTVTTGAQPSVVYYMNDAVVQASLMLQSMFDIGQIEVLKGPQGTLRGEPAPSGAISVTTQKPDLHGGVSGYIDATAATQAAYNGQGAINIPIVQDRLAVRIAGLTDDNRFNDVYSVHNPTAPYHHTEAVRFSALFQPTDNFDALYTYQFENSRVHGFNPVEGTGAPGGTVVVPVPDYFGREPVAAPPAGYNGPPITASERLGVMYSAENYQQLTDVHNLQGNFHFGGQVLSYIGSYNSFTFNALSPQDSGAMLPNYEYFEHLHTDQYQLTQELRLASEERVADLFDYAVGVYYTHYLVENNESTVASFLGGAFGTPFAPPVAGPPNPNYVLPLSITGPQTYREISEYATLTYHVTPKAELTVGGRAISDVTGGNTELASGAGHIALPTAAELPAGVTCTEAGLPSDYPGTCRFPVKGATIQNLANSASYHPVIYSASFDYHFTDGIMGYASVGSSWRPGPTSVGVTSKYDATLDSLVYHQPETSTSYEAGLKTTFLDRRANLNVTVFHQDFKNFIYAAPPAYYLAVTNSQSRAVQTFNFTASGPAKVDGIDVDGSIVVTPRWTIGAALSYADGRLSNANVPCNSSTFNGVPNNITPTVAQFEAAGVYVAECPSNHSISTAPKWDATVQSEYSVPLNTQVDGYVRGLLTYYPSNPNESVGFVVPDYALLNLYLGIRSSNRVWDVTAFVKNATNTQRTLSQNSTEETPVGGLANYFGPSGYYGTTFTPPRQFGLTARYNFGGN
jgi:outer membrane receptor protein involved in Fe transport